ncbi:MAG: DUF642 domain-containing protein [Verrucomicrobia bacterium]|nr:DUF642 domain-containing protein [Verrucomicrobiota bacterium]MDE3099908.1 DUF642 domain-containing protein [Verrucomicrobiota bacterium]
MLFLSAVLLIPGLQGRAQNLLVNGSFETPYVTTPTKVGYPTALWPWQTTATNFEIWTNGWYNPHTGVGPLFSADGGQNLEIISSGCTNATVWQTAPTVAGERYAFSFYFTPRPTVPPDSFVVSINSNIVLSVVDDGTALTNFDWQRFTTDFVADGNLTALSFSDTSLGNAGAGTHIDGVVLEHVPSLTLQGAGSPGFNLCWLGVSNETYQLQFRTNLTAGAWTNLGSPVIGDDNTNSILVTPNPDVPRAYFRIVTGP